MLPWSSRSHPGNSFFQSQSGIVIFSHSHSDIVDKISRQAGLSKKAFGSFLSAIGFTRVKVPRSYSTPLIIRPGSRYDLTMLVLLPSEHGPDTIVMTRTGSWCQGIFKTFCVVPSSFGSGPQVPGPNP